jgi:hypothetical protein
VTQRGRGNGGEESADYRDGGPDDTGVYGEEGQNGDGKGAGRPNPGSGHHVRR